MAGSAKPSYDKLALEGIYTYGTKSGTDYVLSDNTSILGLFDGTQANAWSGAQVAYWRDANYYVIITLHQICNIWRCGTTGWATSNNKLNIFKYNETTGAYDINVTDLYTKTATAITETQWEIFVEKIPPGKYKFAGGNGVRIDSEWYVEGYSAPTFLLYNNEYYIPTVDYYNQETRLFNKVDLATAQSSTDTVYLFDDLTAGDETFKPIDKFKEYPIKLGFNYNALNVYTEEYTSDKELIVGSGNIHLIVADIIDKFQLKYTKTNTNSAFIVCSIDNGITWLTYDFENVEFKPVEGINIANVTSYSEMTENQKNAYEHSKFAIVENGISIDNISSIDWNLLKNSNGDFPLGLKFAYCIVKTGFSDNTNITSLSWQFDAKGYFKKMKGNECDVIIRSNYVEVVSLIDSEMVKVDILKSKERE